MSCWKQVAIFEELPNHLFAGEKSLYFYIHNVNVNHNHKDDKNTSDPYRDCV